MYVFLQDVEYDDEGEEVFSEPRAGASTLHGFFSLRRELSRGVVLLDLAETHPARIAEVLLLGWLDFVTRCC